MQKRFIQITIFSALIVLLFSAHVSADSVIKVKATDTIAGYPTTLKTSYTVPSQKITFRVKKPNGSVIEIYETTNEIGLATTALLGFHTKESGIYEVSAAFFGESQDNILKSIFKVYPEEISANDSRVVIDPGSISADGLEKATIKVSLKDKYQNPIPDHNVIIVSSRVMDEINSIFNKPSDQSGNIFYEISSESAGISHITVIDKISGTVISDREKIIFFEPDFSMNNSGGNYLKADLFGDFDNTSADLFSDDDIDLGKEVFGPIDHFEIDFPSQIEVGSDQGYLTITAKDRDGQTVKNYTGTIRIAIPGDDNAVLPGDGEYTFQEKDQGERTFDLALVFSRTGKQTIQVFDFDSDTGEISEFIKGEKEIEVVEGGTTIPPISSDDIEIKKPQDGAKFGGKTLMIVGKARPNTNLMVFLDEVKVAEVEVDADGIFTKEIQNVDDGNHAVFVRESEGGQESSKTIGFWIDSLPPTLDEFAIYPTGSVVVGEPFTITVNSDPGLQNATFKVSNIVETLLEDKTQKGKYEMTIAAPMSPGEYPISITLTDDLGNKGEFTNAGILKLVPKVAEKELPLVINFSAIPFDASVKLSWDPIVDTMEAKKIEIIYGNGQFNLSETLNIDITEKEILLKDLKNGQNYFFSALTVDDAGNKGEQSAIINVTPDKTHAVANEFVATPSNEKIFLRWTPMESVSQFEISIGIDENNFLEKIRVSGSSSSTVITDLINEQKYFFKLIPISSTNEAAIGSYPLASAIPNWDGSHPEPSQPIIIDNHEVPKHDDSGPLHEKVIFASAFFALGIFFFRKSLVIFR